MSVSLKLLNNAVCMKKIIFLWLFLAAVFLVNGQVLLKTQLPGAGAVLKSQLWNLSLVNTSSQAISVRIEMLMTNNATNQRVLSGVTKLFNIGRGVYQVTPANIIPVSYNVLSPEYNLNIAQEGLLPVGVFNVCYTVVEVNNDLGGPLIEECELIEIEPISPPILVSPGDKELLETPRPLFNWLPPSPVTLFNNLAYDFTLVEVEGIQNAASAIQENIPVYKQQNLLTPTVLYPSSMRQLDTAKTYAWQITARSGFNAIAKSEIWTFHLKDDKHENIQKDKASYYVRLKKELDVNSTICFRYLSYSYNNEINDKSVGIKIFDVTNASHKEVILDSATVDIKYGENFNQLDLTDLLKDNHIYLFDLKNSLDEHWHLRFEYRKSKTNSKKLTAK
jgi:hypothetical protein